MLRTHMMEPCICSARGPNITQEETKLVASGELCYWARKKLHVCVCLNALLDGEDSILLVFKTRQVSLCRKTLTEGKLHKLMCVFCETSFVTNSFASILYLSLKTLIS
jgi:hypothetical protein